MTTTIRLTNRSAEPLPYASETKGEPTSPRLLKPTESREGAVLIVNLSKDLVALKNEYFDLTFRLEDLPSLLIEKLSTPKKSWSGAEEPKTTVEPLFA